MKISYTFYSLKDLSDLSYGEKLLEILLSNGLVIDKAGDHEPIREPFDSSKLPEMWKGVGTDGLLSCCFLFKGQKEIRFMGMAGWDINLPSNTKTFNSISLWFNIPKDYNISRLLQLGDEFFTWCEAVYGYITEDSKGQHDIRAGNIHDGLPGLMWANYFGPTYIMQPDFHLPDGCIPVSHGARLILTDAPNDERLADSSFREKIENTIGAEWFWHYPQKHKRRRPLFDKREIIRK